MRVPRQPKTRLQFDCARFHADLKAVAESFGMSLNQVSYECGVDDSTISNLNKGAVPKGVNLAALGAWSGLNPALYSIDTEAEEFPCAERFSGNSRKQA